MGKDPEKTQLQKTEKTLLAIKEFKRYLDGMEKDLSRTSKKLSNREVAQSVGFVATGIHEALNYLAIVKKVIEKTERIVSKRNVASGGGTDGSTEPQTSL